MYIAHTGPSSPCGAKPDPTLLVLLARSLPNAQRFIWLQEEPLNAGAWSFVSPHIQRVLLGLRGPQAPPLRYVGRPSLPTPAVGLSQAHQVQVESMVKDLLEAIGG